MLLLQLVLLLLLWLGVLQLLLLLFVWQLLWHLLLLLLLLLLQLLVVASERNCHAFHHPGSREGHCSRHVIVDLEMVCLGSVPGCGWSVWHGSRCRRASSLDF